MIHSELAFVTKAINRQDIIDVIEFNLAFGFEQITIYDNESFVDISHSDPRVKILKRNGFANQLGLYNEICKQSNAKWLCLQDDDELLYLRDYNNVNDFLDNYDEFSGVSINLKEISWNHAIRTRVDNSHIHNDAIWLNPHAGVRSHVSTIVKPNTVHNWPTPHAPNVKTGICVMTNKTPIHGANGNIVCNDASFYHYALKDYEYHVKKINRGCADNGRHRPLETFDEYDKRLKSVYTINDTLMRDKFNEVVKK